MRRFFVARAVVTVALVAVGVLVWLLFFAGGSSEPSSELTTPSLPAGDASTTSTSQAGETSTTASGASGVVVFVIEQSLSLATYEIDEYLRGSPNRVVGTTDQVAGQIRVDPSDLSGAVFSPIVVNARTFETDSPRRDQAVRGPIILDSGSDEHEFITFDVASIDGLSGSVDVGGRIEFTISGDLMIRGTTSPATFAVTVTYIHESTIRGTARTIVLRSDYGIGIPSVPTVANVSDEVTLKLDFTASAN